MFAEAHARQPRGDRAIRSADFARHSGFGSHISKWLGPPESQNRTTDFFSLVLPAAALAACTRSNSLSGSPASPAVPICKNQRREPTRIRSLLGGSRGLPRTDRECAASCGVRVGRDIGGGLLMRSRFSVGKHQYTWMRGDCKAIRRRPISNY